MFNEHLRKMTLNRHSYKEEMAQKRHSVCVINALLLWQKEYRGITVNYPTMLGVSHHLGYSCAILEALGHCITGAEIKV